MDNQKKKQLKLTMDKIEKDYGKGAIMTLNEKPSFDAENVLSTGFLSLDKCLGIWGLPKGRIIEIFGPESSGKTTLAMHIIAECQKAGGCAAIVDAEHAFDEQYAHALNINTDNLLISQPDYGEQGLNIVSRLVDSGAVDLIVVDSVAALVPKSELEGEVGDSKMGLQARMMGQTMRMLTAKVSKSNTIVIFINQLREKIGIMFGNPETTTGGNALKFYASIRMDVRKIGQLKDGDDFIGNRVKIKVIKNKVAPPFKTTELDLMYGQGFSSVGDILDAAIGLEIVQKSGSWFAYNSDKLGQGRQTVIDLLKDNSELCEEIRVKVKQKHAEQYIN